MCFKDLCRWVRDGRKNNTLNEIHKKSIITILFAWKCCCTNMNINPLNNCAKSVHLWLSLVGPANYSHNITNWDLLELASITIILINCLLISSLFLFCFPAAWCVAATLTTVKHYVLSCTLDAIFWFTMSQADDNVLCLFWGAVDELLGSKVCTDTHDIFKLCERARLYK